MEALQDLPRAATSDAAPRDAPAAQGQAGGLRLHTDVADDVFFGPLGNKESQPRFSARPAGSAAAHNSDQGAPSSCELVLFKVVHKDISGLKRPLSSVDNVVSGDMAVKLYKVARSGDLDASDANATLTVARSDKPVALLRLLDLSGEPGFTEQDVIRSFKVWMPRGAEAIQIDPEIREQLEPSDLQLMLDMMSARAFAGTGRAFQVYGPAEEWQSLLRMKRLSLTRRVDPKPEPHGEKFEQDTDVEGEWILTPKAVAALTSRMELGSPRQVFSCRPNTALQDKTTLELYLTLTAKGFKDVPASDSKALGRALKHPYSAGRGPRDAPNAHVLITTRFLRTVESPLV